jgi:small-conductance mechanosensitive channel
MANILKPMNQFFSSSLWQQTVAGNTLQDYGFALLALVVLMIGFKIAQVVVIKRLAALAKRTKTDIDDVFIKAINTLRPPFYGFLAFYVAINFLTVEGLTKRVIDAIFIIWITYQVIVAIQTVVNHSIEKRAVHKANDPSSRAMVRFIGQLVRAALWVFGALVILSNLGVNVTSLIAGLGIGGIAIALALQNILGDLFSSFAIYFDKPFAVGDYITIGEHKGTVQKIGIKTTRIKALSGEEVVIANRELTTARVQNFKKLEERRVALNFGVVYDTSPSKLREIPSIVKVIIESQPQVRFGRAHFKEFGASALTFEVIYYVTTPDYNVYMDTQQNINFAVNERFTKEKISMAYPTQTLYLKK